MDLKTGKTEIGQFLISDKPPQNAGDIQGYKQGITDDARQAIFEWSKSKNKDLPKATNWEMLIWQWLRNEPE
jgi:hypothetical protein